MISYLVYIKGLFVKYKKVNKIERDLWKSKKLPFPRKYLKYHLVWNSGFSRCTPLPCLVANPFLTTGT